MPDRSMRLARLFAVLLGFILLNGCQCTSSVCGDRAVDDGEQCDDGNVESGDGCSEACQVEAARCGDGDVNDDGEQCDDGNVESGDGCSATCQREDEPPPPPGCGDGDVDAGETCDDGNTTSGDGCSATCQREDEPPPACGNGVVDVGEQCDDGNATSGDGCENDCTRTPAAEVVCEELEPLADGTCAVMAGAGSTLLRGLVLTPGTIYRGGRVLVDAQGTIACVGCDCAADGATTITCPDGVISPGLINTHDHITFTQNDPYTATAERYEHRHDWRRGNGGHTRISTPGNASQAQVRWGELRFLMGGATSIVGSGSAPGLLRNLDRADQEGLNQPQVDFDTFPLDDSDGTELASGCNYSPDMVTTDDIASVEAYCPHVAEGIEQSARNEFLCLSMGQNNVLKPQSAFIHGIGLTASDYSAMAANGTALIWSPRSNITLYGDTAVVTAAARVGVQIALGTDWVATGSMNLLRELRCAASLNERYYDGFFTDEDLWLMATANAAAVTATDDAIGVLAQGRIADIAIFNGAEHPAHRAILDAEPADVVLVMRGGEVLYGDAPVVAAVRGASACDAVEVCGAAKQVCLRDDIGLSLAELRTAAGDAYDAFFCGDPPGEPTCTPSRSATPPAVPASVNGSNTYTGEPTGEDSDGDGIANAADNCPRVFNPIRPLDSGEQADFDGDGDGDACDPCPLDAGAVTCSAPNPNDGDGDGVLNAVDNCPGEQNTDQADADDDGKGDVCDPCPELSNPGTRGCPASIYAIKNGTVPVGSTVSIESAFVTGTHTNGFFLQVKPGDPGYAGAAYSGVYVYNPGHTVAVGDRLSIASAVVANFFGQIQLSSVTIDAGMASGEAPPDPEVVTPAEIATGGARATELEGVLVEVREVDVIALETMFNEFIVTSDLRVDDLLYLATPFPAIGDSFAVVRGILNFRNSNSKVEPRSAADLVLGAARLTSLLPASSFAYVGQTASATIPEPLTITISSPLATDTFVQVTSSDPAALAVVGGGVTVPAGQVSAPVLLDGLAPSAAVTLTASLGGVDQSASVRVLGVDEAPALSALTPPSATVVTGGTVAFTVTLDIPAPAGGTAVSVAIEPSDAGVAPATVTVPAGQLSATFDYVNGGTATEVTVTATLGASLSSTVSVVAVIGRLVINEVDYDMPVNPDSQEFIEVFNGTSTPVDLAGHELLLVNGATNATYATLDLSSAGTLAPGQYLVVGSTAVMAAGGALKIDFSGTQTDRVQNGAPDGVALVNSLTGTLIDALSYEGEITAAVVTGVGTVSLVEGVALPASAADNNMQNGSLCRLPDGADTDNAATNWAFTATSTPGAANVP